MDTIEKALQRLGKASVRIAPPVSSGTQGHSAIPARERADLLARTEPLFSEEPDRVTPKLAESPALTPAVSLERNAIAGSSAHQTRSVAARSRPKRSIALDCERIRRDGMVVPDDKRSQIKEEYRHIKRPLLMNASGKGATITEVPNLLMVTSARPSEGKTFTATNLALSIAAERDRTVLLVDADVVRQSLSRFFGLTSEPGLVDFLIDSDLSINDVLVETDVESLMLLPAGNAHHLSTELLASKNMRELARKMSATYPERIVIFDSPPLLSTTEASVLATLVGQIVMVVESEKTSRSQVKEALSLLDPNMIIGFVLNKTRHSFGPNYYGYSYYYGGSGVD